MIQNSQSFLLWQYTSYTLKKFLYIGSFAYLIYLSDIFFYKIIADIHLFHDWDDKY